MFNSFFIYATFLRHLIIHSYYSPLKPNCSTSFLKDGIQKRACYPGQTLLKLSRVKTSSQHFQASVYTFQYDIYLFHNTGSYSTYILLWPPDSLPKNFYCFSLPCVNHINYPYISTPPCIYILNGIITVVWIFQDNFGI